MLIGDSPRRGVGCLSKIGAGGPLHVAEGNPEIAEACLVGLKKAVHPELKVDGHKGEAVGGGAESGGYR